MDTLLDAGKWAEAEAKLTEALRLDPTSQVAAQYLARAETRASNVAAPKPAGNPLLSELPVVGKPFATNGSNLTPSVPEAGAPPSEPSRIPLQTRWFKVDPMTLGRNLRDLLGTNALASRNGVSAESALTDLRQLLIATGVELLPPKSIFLNDRSGALMVRGTMGDLEAVEQLIQVLNSGPPQVTLELRLCEITEEDGKKLGFDWFLGRAANSDATNSADGLLGSLPGVAPWDHREAAGRWPGENGSTGPTVTGILTEAQFRVVLRALRQQRGTSVMMSPKVTTLSGRQAQIKTVEIRYIVTGFDFNTKATSAPGAKDESIGIQPIGKPFELGPVIDIVPTVAADGFTIHLTVIASIKEFIGYDNKEGFVATMRKAGSEPQTSPTPLPTFRLRQVGTSAIVWDGQTLVLSGGSMPAGDASDRSAPAEVSGQKGAARLLRSNGTTRQKKTLLVFVTPTIIDPAGNRVHRPEDLPLRKNSVPPQKPATIR